MKKRLLKRGYCTSLVSLPRDWVRRNNLDFGDEVDVRVTGNEIVISRQEETRRTVDLSAVRPWSNHYFCQLYQRGLGEIKFVNLNGEEKRFIKDNLWNFPKSTVTKESENSMTVSIKEPKSSYHNFLKRMFEVTFENIELVSKNLSTEKAVKMRAIKANLREIYQLDELVTRKINEEVPETDYYYLHETPSSLFFINKFLYECMEYKIKRKIKVSEKLIRYLSLNEDYLRMVYNKKYKGEELSLEKHLKLREKLFYEPRRDYEFFDDISNSEFYVAEKILHVSRLVSLLVSRHFMFSKMKEFLQ